MFRQQGFVEAETKKGENFTSIDGKERRINIISDWIGTLLGLRVLILKTFQDL